MSVVTRVRAWPRDPATGAEVPVWLAGGNDGQPYNDAASPYLAGIVAEPRFSASISFDDGGWSSLSRPQVGAVGWQPAQPDRLDAMQALYWRDARIEVDRVVGGAARRRLTGTVADAAVQEGALVLTCADLAKSLDKPVATSTFAGTGGLEGGAFATGRIKRRNFGQVFDVEGQLLDQVYNIYEFGDPAYRLQGCTALRDKGAAGPLGLIAWQGSPAATLAALRAASPPKGGGLFAPSIACARWWTKPAGPLCADLLGEVEGYSANAVGIAAQLIARAQGPVIGNLTRAMKLRSGPCGLHVRDGSETFAAALDRLLGPLTLLWLLSPAGTVTISEWSFDPAESLRAIYVGREATIQPVSERRIGYRKNEREHSESEISAAIRAEDVIYDDGTTAEDWKPAEQGATHGATPAQLAEIKAQQLAQLVGRANAELARLRDRALMFPGPDGASVYTLHVREEQERTTADSAFREVIDLMGAVTPNGNSFVLNGSSVLVEKTVAGATTLVQLGARFGTVEANIEDVRQTFVDDQGNAFASAGMIIDAGGRAVSWRGLSTGLWGNFTFVTDSFTIETPEGERLFYADWDGVKMRNVEVDTLKIGSRYTTNGGQVVTSGTVLNGTGNSNFTTIISDWITLSTAGMVRASATIAQSFPSGDNTWNIRLRINNVEVFAAGGQKTQDVVAVSGALYLPAGTYQVDVRWAAPTGVSNHSKTLETAVLY